MLNPVKSMTFALCLVSTVAFSQQPEKAQTVNFQSQYDAVKASKDKIGYLSAFLEKVKTKPIVFGKATQAVRDSVNNNLQMEYNIMLLAVFTDDKDATVEIKKSTAKAYHIALQTINGQQLTKKRKQLLDGYVAEAHQLIKKHHFLQYN